MFIKVNIFITSLFKISKHNTVQTLTIKYIYIKFSYLLFTRSQLLKINYTFYECIFKNKNKTSSRNYLQTKIDADIINMIFRLKTNLLQLIIQNNKYRIKITNEHINCLYQISN